MTSLQDNETYRGWKFLMRSQFNKSWCSLSQQHSHTETNIHQWLLCLFRTYQYVLKSMSVCLLVRAKQVAIKIWLQYMLVQQDVDSSRGRTTWNHSKKQCKSDISRQLACCFYYYQSTENCRRQFSWFQARNINMQLMLLEKYCPEQHRMVTFL